MPRIACGLLHLCGPLMPGLGLTRLAPYSPELLTLQGVLLPTIGLVVLLKALILYIIVDSLLVQVFILLALLFERSSRDHLGRSKMAIRVIGFKTLSIVIVFRLSARVCPCWSTPGSIDSSRDKLWRNSTSIPRSCVARPGSLRIFVVMGFMVAKRRHGRIAKGLMSIDLICKLLRMFGQLLGKVDKVVLLHPQS